MSAQRAVEKDSDERARVAVRAALRVFGHGEIAAAWLGESNAVLETAPLLLAKHSERGLAYVLAMLDVIASASHN